MIPTISINGNRYHFLFNLVAICKFEESTGINVTSALSMGENMQTSLLVRLIHEALREGHRKATKEGLINTPFDMEWEDVAELIQNNPEDISAAMESIAEQTSDMAPKKKKANYSEKKKKALTRKSTITT